MKFAANLNLKGRQFFYSPVIKVSKLERTLLGSSIASAMAECSEKSNWTRRQEKLVRVYEAGRNETTLIAIADNFGVNRSRESLPNIYVKIGWMRDHVKGEATSKLMKK